MIVNILIKIMFLRYICIIYLLTIINYLSSKFGDTLFSVGGSQIMAMEHAFLNLSK